MKFRTEYLPRTGFTLLFALQMRYNCSGFTLQNAKIFTSASMCSLVHATCSFKIVGFISSRNSICFRTVCTICLVRCSILCGLEGSVTTNRLRLFRVLPVTWAPIGITNSKQVVARRSSIQRNSTSSSDWFMAKFCEWQ